MMEPPEVFNFPFRGDADSVRQQCPTAHLFRSFVSRIPAVVIVIAVAAMLTGCEPQIGDACSDASDCPSGAICDRTVDQGFCTIEDCSPGDCPSEAVCIEYARHEAFCMRSCSDDDDCRRDHLCIDDEHDQSYCFAAED